MAAPLTPEFRKAEDSLPLRAAHAHSLSAPVHSVAIGPANAYHMGTVAQGLYNSYQPLAYKLPWEILDYVEMLSTYNPDYSQAVDNIRTLANSGHEVQVKAGGKRSTKLLKSYLETFSRRIQPSSGGIDGVIDKLLDQASVYGAMAGEWLLDPDTLEVVDFADINPKSVRYRWNMDNDTYEPWQKVSAAQAQQAEANGQRVEAGHIQLNPITFHYFSFDNAPGSPYGTPPFIAALEPIGIQREMVANMSQIVKKLGLLGLVDLVVEQLPPKPGESDEQFQSRATAYLDAYVQAAEDMVRDGGLVHFDDVEVKSHNIAGNASGATNIFKQNEELVFSGLKSMPSVQGRSYSTTETYAGVAYDIIIRNTQRYQRGAKRMIESGYWLASQFAGFNPDSISLDFKPNKQLQRLQNAQAHVLEIKNAAQKWGMGFLDQMGAAMELGYSDIVKEMEDPPDWAVGSLRVSEQEGTATSQASDGGGKPDNGNDSKAQVRTREDDDEEDD